MSLFDYSAAKEALRKAGHLVSEGEHMLATDIKELVKFGRRVFGLPEHIIRAGLGNLSILPEGFPGASAAPVEAAPVVETPAPEAAHVEPAPEVTSAPVAETSESVTQETEKTEEVTADTAKEDSKEEAKADETAAPADGEHAAQ